MIHISQKKPLIYRQTFSKEKGLRSLLRLFGYLGMLNSSINVGKLKNGVFTIYFAYFQDGHKIKEKQIKICSVTC